MVLFSSLTTADQKLRTENYKSVPRSTRLAIVR